MTQPGPALSETPTFEVRLLGGMDVRVGGKPLPGLRSRREQWLLALLVLRQDRDTARDWLATTLWPDNDEQQALFYLRKSLSNLRQALGTEAGRLLSPTPRTVRLDVRDGAFVDVVAFDSALKRNSATVAAAAAAVDPAAALQEAVSLYRGPLLPDCLEEWASVERNQREQAYLTALEALAAHFYALGDPAGAVHWLRLLIAADPYRESASADLMKALADCGDPAAVTVVYQELRARLRQDLNTAPSPETEAAYRQASSGKRESPAAVLPPLPSNPTRRHLPVPLSDLVGRENEIAELLTWLKRRRLVTLLGTGGIGKTRLAIAVAEAALPQFDQGVWFVDLAALSDPALVPQAAARALGITDKQTRPLMETLAEALAERSLLLVLDNCEHLPEACAVLAHDLLSACPLLHVVATSRQALNVMGEQVYSVPALPVPPMLESRPAAESVEMEKDPHFLMEYEAVRLFVDRAVRVNSAFRLNRRNASSVSDICRQLDGIPLAIEMAAARLRSLSVSEINTRLTDRFHLLTSGNRGALPRQQTLRAAVDWSYDLLSDPERTLLRRLSVFAGGWTLEAAESVEYSVLSVKGEESTAAPAPLSSTLDTQYSTLNTLDLLASLVDKSLVIRQEEEESVRYRMLETIRQYGRELLEAEGEQGEIRRRHRDYFLTLVETNRPKLMGPERASWLVVLDTEHDNLRQAIAFCKEDAQSGEQGLRMGAALWGYWRSRGYQREGRNQLAALLSHPGAQEPTKARSDALNAAGVLAFAQSDYAAARALYKESLTICRAREDLRGAAIALSNMGNVAATQGDYARARTLYAEGLEIDRALGNKMGISNVLNNLGNVANEQGEYDEARALHEESLALKRELGERAGVASSLNNLGILAEARGDYATARTLFAESLEIHREIGPRTAEANNLFGLGNVALRQGDYGAARAQFEESLTIRRDVGDRWGIAISLHGLGETAFQQGDYHRARSLFKESLIIRRELENRWGIAVSFGDMAFLARQEGNYERAVLLWSAAAVLREANGAVLPPRQREESEREMAATREDIGEERFAAAWEAGRLLALEDAIQYALESAAATGPPRPHYWGRGG